MKSKISKERIEKNQSYMKLFTSICVIVLYFIWPYFVSSILSLLGIKEPLSVYLTLVADFILMIVIISIYFDGLRNDFIKLKKNFKKLFILGGKIFILGFIVYTIVSSVFIFIVPEATNANTNSLLNIFDKSPMLLFIIAIFYYPIIEELVFKKTFKDVLTNKWFFIITTAIINASFEVVLSYQNIYNLVNIIPTAVFYGMLSYIYYETDNIFVSMGYRMIYNLIPFLLALLNVAIIIF